MHDTEEAAAVEPEAGSAQRRLTSGLYVVATPIGNLEDLTRRAERVIAQADVLLCEDSRVAARLMGHVGLRRSVQVYNDHTGAQLRPGILRRLSEGASVALTSDAGTPTVSDPGFKLIRDAVELGVVVVPVPGPSAVMAGLVVAGLPTDRFMFAGFLPPKSGQRRAALEELRAVPATLVLFETGPRLAEALADAAVVLGPRRAAIARELTKLHEEVRRGPLDRLAAELADEPPPKGEIVLVIEGAAGHPAVDEAAVDAALAEALVELRPRAAAARVAEVTGRPVNDLYRRAVALKPR